MVTDRIELLKALPKNAKVAELGVEIGLFSAEILKVCEPTELHLIDTWPDESILEKCKDALTAPNVHFHQTTSVEWLENQPLESLDWLYIDTDHTYHTTKQELELASKVVKPDGIICGHDYTSVSYNGLRKYGVVEAVNEFCVNHNYELVYLTNETGRHLSWGISRLN